MSYTCLFVACLMCKFMDVLCVDLCMSLVLICVCLMSVFCRCHVRAFGAVMCSLQQPIGKRGLQTSRVAPGEQLVSSVDGDVVQVAEG